MIRGTRGNRLLAAFAILIFGAGCGGDGGSAALDEVFGEPETGGTVVIAEGYDMGTPLIFLAQSLLDGNLGGDVMFMELVRGGWEDGRLIFRTGDENPMAIARSYEYVGADSTSLRFRMRSDVRWSDGIPLTAADVAYTYSLLTDPALASPLQGYLEFIESVEAENDSTVVFNYRRRHPDMLAHAAIAPVPRHIFGDTPAAEFRNHPALRDPQNGNLVVSGPYMIGTWDRGQRIVLVRNPHFEPRGRLDQIVFRVLPDPATRLVELQTGGVDVLQGIPFDQLPQLRQQAPHVQLEKEEKRVYDYVSYNGPGFAPFEDPEVRRALGLALDVESVIRALQMEEFAFAAGGPYAPIFRDLYDPEGQAPLPYEPDEARRILESKGWRDTNNDGVLDRAGQPFRFTLSLSAGNQLRADIAQVIQQQWRQVGVDARIQVVEFNTLIENVRRGNFEALLGAWSVSLSPDLSSIWAADSPFNYTRYSHPDVTRLIEQARAQPAYEASVPLWRQAASRIVQDQPYTWLFYRDYVDGVNERVRGTKIDTYGIYQNVWEWWIPESRRRPGETLVPAA